MHIPKKYIVWVGILFLVVLGCIFISTQLYKPNVNFELAPDSATIKLDGSKKITAGGQKITPGKHTVSGSMNGFATKSISFTVTSSGVTTVIVVLDPNSAAGYDYLNKHPDQQRLRQKYGGLDYTAKATQLAQKNPIVRVLPYSSPDNTFRIDYGSDTPNASAKQTIFITASKQL
jgi:hypothetical protein